MILACASPFNVWCLQEVEHRVRVLFQFGNLCFKYNAEISLYKPWRTTVFFQFKNIINVLGRSLAAFEYLLYEYFVLSVQGLTSYVRIWRLWTSYSDVYSLDVRFLNRSLCCKVLTRWFKSLTDNRSSKYLYKKVIHLKGPLAMRHFQCCQFWKFNLYEAI